MDPGPGPAASQALRERDARRCDVGPAPGRLEDGREHESLAALRQRDLGLGIAAGGGQVLLELGHLAGVGRELDGDLRRGSVAAEVLRQLQDAVRPAVELEREAPQRQVGVRREDVPRAERTDLGHAVDTQVHWRRQDDHQARQGRRRVLSQVDGTAHRLRLEWRVDGRGAHA